MMAFSWQDAEKIDVKKVMLFGETCEVNGVAIRWLSKAALDADGNPQYGLRHFTVEPGAEIPMHNHSYHQTVYILSGQFECATGSKKDGSVTETRVCGPGDVVYSPGLEPHAMKNLSSTEPATFLCCIATV